MTIMLAIVAYLAVSVLVGGPGSLVIWLFFCWRASRKSHQQVLNHAVQETEP